MLAKRCWCIPTNKVPMKTTPLTASTRSNPSSPYLLLTVFSAALALLVCLPLMASAWAAGRDNCLECHSDPRFKVENRKLYNYFQEWNLSVHRLARVGCHECHGGDPAQSDAQKAHGKTGLKAGDPASPIHFSKVGITCGKCHQEVLKHYEESRHYEKMLAEKPQVRGPNCVTCHGSTGTRVPNPNNVAQLCGDCHRAPDGKPAPGKAVDVPRRAEELLGRFLSIDRFIYYLTVKGEPSQAARLEKATLPEVKNLKARWHTFDLDGLERDTAGLLAPLAGEANVLEKVLWEKKQNARKR